MAAIANRISCTDYFSQTSYKKKKVISFKEPSATNKWFDSTLSML